MTFFLEGDSTITCGKGLSGATDCLPPAHLPSFRRKNIIVAMWRLSEATRARPIFGAWPATILCPQQRAQAVVESVATSGAST